MEVKVMVQDIKKLKTATEVQEERDKETGEVVERHLVTKLSIEAEIAPVELANIHHLLAADVQVCMLIGSPQQILPLAVKEGAFAGV